MRLQKLTKKQIREALDQQPLNQILQVENSKLTNKQIKFCEQLALGESKASAYRKSHNSKAKPSTQANNGYRMAKRDDIQAMTEAIKQGIEFQKLYTAGQIRALVVQRLTQEAISEDSNPSVRVNALKALGTIAGVDAFVHRSETKVIKDSNKAREELLNMLKQSIADNARTITQEDQDILELMAEIAPTPSEKAGGEIGDPLPPDLEVGVPQSELHSTPHTQSPSQSSPKEPSEVIENNLEENQ
jgi:dGTP triphosphohydrolase